MKPSGLTTGQRALVSLVVKSLDILLDLWTKKIIFGRIFRLCKISGFPSSFKGIVKGKDKGKTKERQWELKAELGGESIGR